jgi:hypothetical protein
MATESVSKNLRPKDGQPGGDATIQFNFPETLQQAAEQYGEETVFELFLARSVVLIQSEMGKVMSSKDEDGNYIYLNAETDKLEVPQQVMDDYFDGFKISYKRGRSSDPLAKIQKAIGDPSKMSDEQKEAMAAQLRALLGL